MIKKKIRIEYLIDTDILYDHLIKDPESGESHLVILMKQGMCFTTVLNAAELFLMCKDAKGEHLVKTVLSALHILGIHARYSLNVNLVSPEVTGLRDILFTATAEINKLNIVTLNVNKYKSDKIMIYKPEQLVNQN